jgi:hypothetical protein
VGGWVGGWLGGWVSYLSVVMQFQGINNFVLHMC